MRSPLLNVAILTALVGGCAANSPAPRDARQALVRYYATLDQPLPIAPPGAALDPSAAVSRIAFGSCNHQDRQQSIWQSIAAQHPDLFLMIGDNVYGDIRATGAADIPTLRAAYARLAEREEFRRFRASVPMLATWDDHDFGHNDGGASFAFKPYAERIFEHFWGSDDAVRSRPGVYHQVVLGPPGRRVQIILLDTRYFRSDLTALPYREKAPPLGWYVPNADPGATLLGERQWRWLEQALDRPAEIRLIVSSIQILSNAHGFEKWGNFPGELARLTRLLERKGIDNALLLSGDRHRGAIYRSATRPSVYEMTSSSLNYSFARPGEKWIEPDPLRLGEMISAENFGMIEIDWAKGSVRFVLRGNDGATLASHQVR